LANRIDEVGKAYELYLRTSRLDLDDYNKEVREGLHITSMGGTWMSIVIGFGGMHIKDGKLSFNTNIPAKWEHLSFNVNFRNHLLRVDISRQEVKVTLVRGEELEVIINGKTFIVKK
jgi:maltose phosphorylase